MISTHTIVIGAGHAGLGISYYLKENNIAHIVFERGRIGESWRSQRWDSFSLNTPNWVNTLPGDKYNGKNKENFSSAKDFANSLSDYVTRNNLPVVENSSVISLKRTDDGKFKLSVVDEHDIKTYTCNKVIVASGIMNEVKVPEFSKKISPDILQLHTSEYKNPSQLPDGAAMVAGAGQSGCQIVEDLLEAGREVYFSSSKVPRAPRRYRGRDIIEWMILSGFWDAKTDETSDPNIFNMRQPQISGVGMLGHTVSLQHLASRGVKILGKLKHIENSTAYFHPDAAENVRFADEFSKKLKDMADEYIKREGLDAPAPEPDPADESDSEAKCASNITELDLKSAKIKTIIFTTGFGADFGWIKLPVLDHLNNPKYIEGKSAIDGLYFLGFPWLRKRKSGVIYGINEDAEYLFSVMNV